jgi:hypothetical protein
LEVQAKPVLDFFALYGSPHDLLPSAQTSCNYLSSKRDGLALEKLGYGNKCLSLYARDEGKFISIIFVFQSGISYASTMAS